MSGFDDDVDVTGAPAADDAVPPNKFMPPAGANPVEALYPSTLPSGAVFGSSFFPKSEEPVAVASAVVAAAADSAGFDRFAKMDVFVPRLISGLELDVPRGAPKSEAVVPAGVVAGLLDNPKRPVSVPVAPAFAVAGSPPIEGIALV